MSRNKYQAAAIALLLVLHTSTALPYGSMGNDIEDLGYNQPTANGNRPVDYHTVVGHFKDFFMYLPVMMTTIKETMTGFPKFAEGIRILTSGKGRIDEEDCKCSKSNLAIGTSSELENTSHFG